MIMIIMIIILNLIERESFQSLKITLRHSM